MKSAVVSSLLVFATVVQASPTWIGASGNWSDPANWQDGVLPTETDTVCVSNTVPDITINLDAPSVTLKAIRFDGHTAAGDVTVTGGKLILTSSSYNMVEVINPATGKVTDYNTRHYDRSTAAIIAYPYGAIFDVPVEFTSTGTAGYMATGRDIHFRKSVTGPDVKTFSVHSGIHVDQLGYITGDKTTHTYFHGSVVLPKANLNPYQAPTGGLYFFGPMCEFDSMIFGSWVNPTVRLMSTNTVVHSGIIAPAYGACFESEVGGTYPTNTIVHFQQGGGSAKDNDASVDLGFVDRTFDRLTSVALSLGANKGWTIRSCGKGNQGGVYYSGSAPTTLTLRGTADAATAGRIMDDITVVWDPVGNFTQTFSNRTHTTKGSFVVKRGTMKLNGAGSIAAARALEIAAGAAFELDSSLADPLPRDLIVTKTSRLKLNGATVHVKRLVVDGVAQADATYTGEDWMDGDGSVVVAAGNCRTWIGTAGGDWTDATKWLGGKMPDSTNDIAVLDAQTDADLTIAFNADIAATNFPGVLEIVNRGAGTTTLSVAASVTNNNGFVRVGRHARVEVPACGTFFYETATSRAGASKPPNWTYRPVLSVVDGGQWRTCGGTTVYTNLCGQCWVNGEGSKLLVSEGLHLHSGWNSDYPLSIGTGARLELTGGTLCQPHEGYNQNTDLRLFGGTADFSGGIYDANKTCVGTGSGGGPDKHGTGINLGYGTFLQHGTVDVKFPSTIALCSFFTGTHLEWIVKDNVKLYGNHYLIGGRRYGDATVTIYDKPTGDSREWVACGNYFLGTYYNNNTTGADAGDGRLYIKSGAQLFTGFNGVYVGSGLSQNFSFVPLYLRGFLRVEPNAELHAYGSTHTAYGSCTPCGISVGMAGRIAITSGRPCEGRAEVAGLVSNKMNLVVGGWHGRGVYVQEGGMTETCTQALPLEHGLAAVGFAGGEGALLVSNGLFISRQNVWVGGCFTNEFVVQKDNAPAPNLFVEKGGWPLDDHSAEGLLEVSDGAFETTKNLYVGADGTGVVSVVGSSGSFHVAQNLVLSNQSASVARFTADAAGVKPIVVGGRLVLTDASSLDVDLSACAEARRVKLFTATGGVEGAFGTVNITPLDKRELVRRGNDLYVVNRIGSMIIVR